MQATQAFKFDVPTIAGVAFDGTNVWASLLDKETASLAKIDRKSGEILQRVATERLFGIAWDGAALWAISAAGGILQFNAETLAVVTRLPQPKTVGMLSGLAWDGGALWAGDYRQKKLLKICPKTGRVLKEIASDRFVTGVTWVNGKLWHAVDDEENPPRPTELRHLDAGTGAVLKGIELPFSVTGLAYDGELFWCGESATGTLRSVK